MEEQINTPQKRKWEEQKRKQIIVSYTIMYYTLRPFIGCSLSEVKLRQKELDGGTISMK